MRKHLFDVIRAKVFQLWKRPKPRLTTLFIILGMCGLWLKSSIRVFPCLNIVGQFNFCCFIYIFYFCPLWGVVRNMLLSWLNQHLNPMCMHPVYDMYLLLFEAKHWPIGNSPWALWREGGCGDCGWLWHSSGRALREPHWKLHLCCPGDSDWLQKVRIHCICVFHSFSFSSGESIVCS